MGPVLRRWLGGAFFVGLAIEAPAAGPGPEALEAWQQHLQAVQARLRERLDGKRPFLWADEVGGRRERLRRGQILTAPQLPGGRRDVPGGLIHDWIGAVFLPEATLGQVLAVVHDYDNYREFFKPTVVRSELLERDANRYRFSMRWVKKVLFVTAAVDGVYESTDSPVDARRWFGVARSVRIQEVRNPGGPNEQVLPPDTGSGYLWRVYSISRYLEEDGGVYAELEALALSRNVPAYLRWLVNPVVSRLSRSSLVTSLEQIRQALKRKRAPR